MKVYIVCGSRYHEVNDAFLVENIAVYTNEQEAKEVAEEAQTFDENEGYLSNYYWVEEWEVE